MSWLIDAEVLIEDIEHNGDKAIIDMIESQPIAYDPEAVVYELEKSSYAYTTVSDLGIPSIGRKLYLKDAIEIVRNGGVK